MKKSASYLQVAMPYGVFHASESKTYERSSKAMFSLFGIYAIAIFQPYGTSTAAVLSL